MSSETNRGPGYAKNPEHRVTVAPFEGRIVVEAQGQILVDTRRALVLREASYPPVYYVPRAEANMDRLEKTAHHTYCPYKGEASYFRIAGLPNGDNAVWTYETPYDEVVSIKDALAFYPDRVTIRAEPE